MTPSPEEVRLRLAQGAGRWRGIQTHSDTAGGEALVVVLADARLTCGGNVLVTEHRQELDGEVLTEGYSVTAWHGLSEAFVMYFFDGSGDSPAEYRGGWQRDALILEGSGAQGTVIRHRTTYPGPGLMRTVSALSMDAGRSWTEVFVGDYQREV